MSRIKTGDILETTSGREQKHLHTIKVLDVVSKNEIETKVICSRKECVTSGLRETFNRLEAEQYIKPFDVYKKFILNN